MQRIAPAQSPAQALNPFAEPEPNEWGAVEACRGEYDVMVRGRVGSGSGWMKLVSIDSADHGGHFELKRSEIGAVLREI
jgi:hypothetical protein